MSQQDPNQPHPTPYQPELPPHEPYPPQQMPYQPQHVPYPYAVPPVPPKKNNCLMFALIGVAVLAMCVIIGLAITAIGGKAVVSTINTAGTSVAATAAAVLPAVTSTPLTAVQSTSAIIPAQDSVTALAPTSAPSMPKRGDKVTVGSWDVTVQAMVTSTGFDWSGFKNMQEPKGIYVLVYEDATNTTPKSASINSFDYKLVDATGAEFASCTEIGCIAYPKQIGRDSFLTQVPPRLSTKLLAIFDVAPGSKGLVLVIEQNTKIALGDL